MNFFVLNLVFLRKITCSISLIPLLLIVSCTTTDTHKDIGNPVPANTHASPAATAVLRYIADLSKDVKPGVISGQNCYHGDQIGSSHELNGFQSMVENLYNLTGKWVGMIGVDYEHDRIYTPGQLSAANAVLIEYWKQGGLITINWAPHNPWVNDESDLINNHGTWNGPGASRDLTGVDLPGLTDPDSPVYPVWRKKLDRIAAALAELRDAGVVVLWRPLQEMNGNWFWWGIQSHQSDPSPFIEVYRDMFRYFSGEKHLDNLLWVYSPNQGSSFPVAWLRPVDWCYPGDEFVDIVAGTSYNDKLDILDYRKYLSMGKPLGMAEYGPDLSGKHAKNGDFDTTGYAGRLLDDYPAIAYWVSWHSFPGLAWSLISNRKAEVLLDDPGVITRERVDWK